MLNPDIDQLTRKLMIPEEGEDPFCCTVTRRIVVNAIRKEYGLPYIQEEYDGNRWQIRDMTEAETIEWDAK